MTHRPRMPRADLPAPPPADNFTARLSGAVTAGKEHVTWHRPEHRSDSIEPGEGLMASYLNGIGFGEGHRD